MKTKSLFIFLFLIIISQQIFAQQITGSWKGELDIQGTKLPVIMNISQEKNVYSATMDSPLQGVEGIPVDKITFTNNELALEITSAGATYKGKFEKEKFSGNFIQRGNTFPLVLERFDKKNNKDKSLEVLKLTSDINGSLKKIDDFLSYLEKKIMPRPVKFRSLKTEKKFTKETLEKTAFRTLRKGKKHFRSVLSQNQ
ncbi:hypothetical protein ACFOEQ_09100 [Chryseobacterium arachidis]|uniref:hypothetical protein n=1 Tax=Chryseobacterium arachidis TaxID=1416778 RepID=UPI00361FBDEA